MDDNEEGEETVPRGNEWEVVSLTASTYAAAPGPEHVDPSHYHRDKVSEENEPGTSNAMFMSGHFVFPPSQHENLPLEPKYNEIHDEKVDDADTLLSSEKKRDNSGVKTEENASIEGLISDEFPGVQIFDKDGNILSASGADSKHNLIFDKEKSAYSSAELCSFHSEKTVDKSDSADEGEGTNDAVTPEDYSSDLEFLNLQRPFEGDKDDAGNLPSQAWWKKRAISLYSHAKEANTFWSIFVAAAVMGLVILGHRWQQDRWQVLHLKWQFGHGDERMSKVFGPLSRFKDVVVGGHRPGSLLRGSTTTER